MSGSLWHLELRNRGAWGSKVMQLKATDIRKRNQRASIRFGFSFLNPQPGAQPCMLFVFLHVRGTTLAFPPLGTSRLSLSASCAISFLISNALSAFTIGICRPCSISHFNEGFFALALLTIYLVDLESKYLPNWQQRC